MFEHPVWAWSKKWGSEEPRSDAGRGPLFGVRQDEGDVAADRDGDGVHRDQDADFDVEALGGFFDFHGDVTFQGFHGLLSEVVADLSIFEDAEKRDFHILWHVYLQSGAGIGKSSGAACRRAVKDGAAARQGLLDRISDGGWHGERFADRSVLEGVPRILDERGADGFGGVRSDVVFEHCHIALLGEFVHQGSQSQRGWSICDVVFVVDEMLFGV